MAIQENENGVAHKAQATIRDVAHKARVSIATVSRVVNGTRFVEPTTKARVHAAMRDLGYSPNFLARGLRQQSTQMIGLVVPDNSNPFYAEVARAIEDTGYVEGYSVILCNSDMVKEKQLTYIDVLLSRRVDGLVLLSAPSSPTTIERVLAAKVPIVITNSENANLSVDEVVVDTEHGGYIAGEYLVQLGHRRIGCIAGPHDAEQKTKRIKGFCRALSEVGIYLEPRAITYGDERYESGRKAMRQLLESYPDLTAVFVFDDLMAIGAMNVLLTTGIKVPDDVSIIGFDNILLASAMVPGITTVAQPITEIGYESIRLLIERIQQPDKERSRIMLPTRLIERASCRTIS